VIVLKNEDLHNIGIVLNKDKITLCNDMGVPDYLGIALSWLNLSNETGEKVAKRNYQYYIGVAEEFGMCERVGSPAIKE